MRFSYRPYLVSASAGEGSSLVYRPVVTITLAAFDKSRRWDALVDTGADECIFPRSVAQVLGAGLGSTDRGQIGGVGGASLECLYAEVELGLGRGANELRWQARVGFIDYSRIEGETLILGHAGFLEHFTALFDGAARFLELHPNPTLPRL